MQGCDLLFLNAITVDASGHSYQHQALATLGLAIATNCNEKQAGSMAVGMQWDFVCWIFKDGSKLCYRFSHSFQHRTMKADQWQLEEPHYA